MKRIIERHIKIAVKKRLNELGAYHFWPVQTGIGASTVDCLGCYKGRFFAIETKAPGKHPTDMQFEIINKIKLTGGIVLVIDSLDKAAIFTLPEILAR